MQTQDDPEPAQQSISSPRARDWLWRPWYAKVWWTMTLLYWIGLEALITVPFEHRDIDLVTTMVLLVFILNPIAVTVVLGYGFLRAKVACGDWIIVPGPPQQRPLIDPTTDPFDVRSGIRHLRHIGVIKDRR